MIKYNDLHENAYNDNLCNECLFLFHDVHEYDEMILMKCIWFDDLNAYDD